MARTGAALRTLIALILVWQGAVWVFQPPRYILPSVADVAAVFGAQAGYLARHSLTTVTEIALGFVFGTSFGVLAAFFVAAVPRLGRLVWPMLLVLQALPVFVIAPLLVVWFGFGMLSKVVMTTIIIFFPVASAFADGLRRVDRDILDATALTGASHWRTLVDIRVPLALPALMTGLRVAAPLAPLGAVVGEWVGASAGLGFVMGQANARMQTATAFAAMAIIAALSLALRALVDEVARRVAPWAHEQES
ncbi:putative hydroxymethylpyrimidine transport system permease protein [Pseudochelatococcus lubricantis]|uniref:Hydroxymethylpyrimidine transport system permease protein n=1 Tax=Pseudochelatococcus lubricantis TaxID=1538102 RepID=A0ABX0UU47_9HYPH|nr:ABC transporter permease [Pseudochelatococcus lubricantis]NIJ56482.1 putative hydroxymethylpyrimidine transport system permease protein [Pseudochelatococcus lubricantis]